MNPFADNALEVKWSEVGDQDECGGARGAFYRVADDEVRHRRRQPASGECGLKDFRFEVEKEREGSQSDAVLVGDLKKVVWCFVSPAHT
jgi:hypothetical protein